MPGFLEDFFPEVLQHVDAREDCKSCPGQIILHLHVAAILFCTDVVDC